MAKNTKSPKGQVVIYKHKFEVRLEKETVWLSLNQMADLFNRDKSVVSQHLNNQKSWIEVQLLHFLQQFKVKEGVRLREVLNISIWTSLFP